jgi:hypothetical protein
VFAVTSFPAKPWDGYKAPSFDLHPEVPAYWHEFFSNVLEGLWTIVEENEGWVILSFSIIMAVVFGAAVIKIYAARKGVGNIPSNAGNSLDANGL